MKNNLVTFPTPTPTINAQLKSAITNKRLVEFTYHGQRRIAEPHDYGRRHGIDKLLVYQRRKAGRYITGWRSIEVQKIEGLVVLTDTFPGSRADAQQDHMVWDELYARVE